MKVSGRRRALSRFSTHNPRTCLDSLEINPLPLHGIKPRILGPPAHSVGNDTWHLFGEYWVCHKTSADWQ
jgi:hypothetical protein